MYLGAYDKRPVDTTQFKYLAIDGLVVYNAFHLDFGPLHIGSLYRFATALHEVLNREENAERAIVIYSSLDHRQRANAACLLASYMVLIQSWSPHQVLQPLAQVEPPFMGFRDAGYSHADFEITIQDVVYGLWRARERKMVDLVGLNLEDYELYERVDHGDFNVISEDFIAFASPQQGKSGALNSAFKHVLSYFQNNNVQMVVRLNSHLYNKDEFESRGIQHLDMIFDDGTCPTMDMVKDFIGVSEGVIKNGGKIAVHCKAGLGRTGCLIGAHLIYTHGFTANECIAYMRTIRPGMVVGPQQHWLYLHQNQFREWKYTMVLDNVPSERLGGFSSLISYDDFKKRKSLESPSTPVRRRVSLGTTNLHKSVSRAVPLQSPGQPRKSPERNYANNNNNSNNNSDDEEDYHSTKDNIPEEEEEPKVSYTKTITTTKTTTISSPPGVKETLAQMPKQRSRVVSNGVNKAKSSRVGSGVLGNAGVRKTSSSKR